MRKLAPIAIVGLGALAIWGWLALADHPQNAQAMRKVDPALAARVRAELAQEERLNNVRLAKTAWHKGGFGTVMVATFQIHNGNDTAVKDAVVSCDQFGPSGTLIGTATRTIYQSLPPNADTTVADFDMGFIHVQSATTKCKVTYIASS